MSKKLRRIDAGAVCISIGIIAKYVSNVVNVQSMQNTNVRLYHNLLSWGIGMQIFKKYMTLTDSRCRDAGAILGTPSPIDTLGFQ